MEHRLWNVRCVSESILAKCREISRLQERAVQNGLPQSHNAHRDYILRSEIGRILNSMQTVTTSADFAGGTEVTEPHPIIAFLLASSSHLPLEIANLGSAEIGVRDAWSPIDRSRPSIPWTAVTALTSRIYRVSLFYNYINS